MGRGVGDVAVGGGTDLRRYGPAGAGPRSPLRHARGPTGARRGPGRGGRRVGRGPYAPGGHGGVRVSPGRRVARLDIEPGTPHAATVGRDGVRCVEAPRAA